jgi:hypothetical protein
MISFFGDFGTGMEKMGIPGKKKDIGKKAMRTLVLLQMALRMAYDDRRKVSKPERR